MNLNLIFFINILLLSITIHALEVRDVVFLILSQSNSYNAKLAIKLKETIILEAKELKQNPPIVYLSHKDFPYIGEWTVFPLIPMITNSHSTNSKWLFICTDQTNINLGNLLKTIAKYNDTEELWFGHALHDREASIIHHFAFFENPETFLYPNMASGYVMSFPLLKKITKRIENSDFGTENVDFSIDPSHELAFYIWMNGAGSAFKNNPKFCITPDNSCATYVAAFIPCEKPVPLNSIYFGVKTCNKYHEDRVSIVKQTWANFTTHIEYFSDELNESIPTVSLGTPNTERGHCAKTIAILQYLAKKVQNLPNVKWIVITDDDTIISPGRLRQLLSCYSNENYPLALGERYGYRVRDSSNMGYNYITGGGGMVFDKDVVFELVEGPNACRCPKPDTPDDMYIGICLAERGVPITHSPHFHQARPIDYAADYLSMNEAISFHKHWMIEPVQVYQQWFLQADKLLIKLPNVDIKTEL